MDSAPWYDGPHRIEYELRRALTSLRPRRLHDAVELALFPGGARVRSRLCLAVARACTGHPPPDPSVSCAVALELLHCASLVHDDLPCFDDADMRRRRPTIHRAFGEAMAVLVGDALIVHAFGALCAKGVPPACFAILARAAGSPEGLVAGQAWELEGAVPDVAAYHAAKTGALFRAAVALGATSVGFPVAPFEAMAEALGAAYQIADDLIDVAGDEARDGKTPGRDRARGRPSAVCSLGVGGALESFRTAIERARGCVPACTGVESLRSLVAEIASRLEGRVAHLSSPTHARPPSLAEKHDPK